MKTTLIIGLLLMLPLATAIPAFPGAEGYGAEALDSCDRTKVNVIEVTNLEDGPAGSLRDAFSKYQDGILNVIVFRVGGIIELDSSLNSARGIGYIDNHNCIYVAGQTAPGDGITLRYPQNRMFWFRNGQPHDLVFRYMRFRGGKLNDNLGHILFQINSGNDIIFDHNSFSWANDKLWTAAQLDENTYSKKVYDISFQRNLLSEVFARHPTSLHISGTPKTDSPTKRVSVSKNLIAHGSHRNPNVNAKEIKVVNNVIYNWKQGATHTNGWATVDVMNNYYKKGPMTESRFLYEVTVDVNGYTANANTRIFVEGNVGPHNDDVNADNWADPNRMVSCYYKDCNVAGGGVLPSYHKKSTPFPQPNIPIEIMDTYDAYDSVLADSGANKKLDCNGNLVNNQDVTDKRIVNEVKTGTGTNHPLINEAEVGGQPPFNGAPPCPDSDHDGMFDAWEVKYDLNPNFKGDNAGDLDHDGYSNLEEFLNGQDPRGGDVYVPPVVNPPDDPPPAGNQYDLNNDNEVNLLDLILTAKAIGSQDMIADFKADGEINIFDLILLVKNFT